MHKKSDKTDLPEKNLERPDFDRKDHWEQVYSRKQSTEVSWYQQHPERSLELIKATGVDASASIIDIGGGASTLVDFLLEAGYKNLSVLDISHTAIEQAKSRLGRSEIKWADKVEWLEQDIAEFKTERYFDVWHDRAVFHFLTDEKDRAAYVHAMLSVLNIGAFVIIAAFDVNGPKKCSGLEVMHYSPEKMSAVLGASFQLIETSSEDHLTPKGASQSFVYCRFLRV